MGISRASIITLVRPRGVSVEWGENAERGEEWNCLNPPTALGGDAVSERGENFLKPPRALGGEDAVPRLP